MKQKTHLSRHLSAIDPDKARLDSNVKKILSYKP